jgi:hypothetical protein
METILIVFGLGCLIGAVVGGGVKVRQKETELQVPLIASTKRQVLLGGLGVALIGSGGYLHMNDLNHIDRAMSQIVPGAFVQPGPGKRPSDPLAGTWRSADGSSMQFRRTSDGYTVTSAKPGGLTDTGSASLDGDGVSLALRNVLIGPYTGEFTLDGDRMSGSIVAAGMQIPAMFTRD